MHRHILLVPFALASVLAAGVAACVGDDPSVTPTPDPGGDDAATASDTSLPIESGTDASADVAVDAALCNPAAAFGAPVALDALNTGEAEESVALSADELTVYFTSATTLKQATRASLDVPFSNVGTVAVANQPNTHEAFLSHDGQVLYSSVGTSGPQITLSRFGAGGFTAPETVFGTQTGGFAGSDPYLNRQKSTLYYTLPTIPAGGGAPRNAIYRATIVSPTALTGETQILELTSDQGERHPVVSLDERTMFFASLRQSTTYDIWVATRGSIAATWGTAVKVDTLSTTGDDYPGWLSDDGCRMYLVNRSSGNLDIYLSKRGL